MTARAVIEALTAKLCRSASDDDFHFPEHIDKSPKPPSNWTDCADFDPAQGGTTGINRR